MGRPSISANPEFLSQWDYEKNHLDPNLLTQGSSKKACVPASEWQNHFDKIKAFRKMLRDLEPFEYLAAYSGNPDLQRDWDLLMSYDPKHIFYAHVNDKIVAASEDKQDE